MQLVVVYITRCNHHDVLTHVVLGVVLLDHLPVDGLHVGQVAQDRQADLLLLENPPMRDLDGSFQGLCLSSFQQLPMNSTPLIFHILLAI